MENFLNFIFTYWYIVVGIVVFAAIVLLTPKSEDDDPFTLDERSSNEEREVFANMQELIEKKKSLIEQSPEEYILVHAGGKTLSIAEEDDLREKRFNEGRVLSAKIYEHQQRFLYLKRTRQAGRLEYEANLLLNEFPENKEVQKKAKALIKKSKKLVKQYA